MNQPRTNIKGCIAGNGSKAICRVSNASRSPSPDPRRSQLTAPLADHQAAKSPMIRFSAKLLKPSDQPKNKSWLFLILPKAASAKLPSRSMTSVVGTICGVSFGATLEPDGQGSHWLRVHRKLLKATGLAIGDVANLEVDPATKEPEPKVPAGLKQALSAAPQAKELWLKITPVARRDWKQWIDSAKQAETRTRRISNACSMLASGKRRVCCFDRSGIYSTAISVPKASQ